MTGPALDARAALCTLARDGRLSLPAVQSNDARLIGDKKLDKQTNRKLEILRHPSGWTLTFATVADFGERGHTQTGSAQT